MAGDARLSLPEDLAPAAVLRAALEYAAASVPEPLVLAVSGGLDSMALLHAMHRWAPTRIAAVATFDHGTGDYATEAASLVAAEARRLGLTVVRERARHVGRSEAAWRDARWVFLRRVARGFRARVATAHTRDDQLETIVMRWLRGSGARGLAALAAPSPVVRPWLAVSRTELAQWTMDEGIPYLEDPMNADLAYTRARLRHRLLPMLVEASEGFADEMLALGDQAASWRREVDQYLDANGVAAASDGRRLVVRASLLTETTPDGQAILWPAICARAGITLDARGTQAAVRFTTSARRGAHIELAGGVVILCRGDARGTVFEVRRGGVAAPGGVWSGPASSLPGRWGRFRIRRLGVEPLASDAWSIGLPVSASVVIRPWQEGDRIQSHGAPAGRRVTRYFSESRVPVPDRSEWPVLLVEDEVAWVPGVCRGLAAPSRPGRSELIWYRCEPEFD